MTTLEAMTAELRNLMDDVSRLIGSVGVPPRESTWGDAMSASLFDRCRGLFGAVYLLVREGFSQEALLIGRPLLTDSLALQELAAGDSRRRTELAFGWELATLADLDGVWLAGQKQGRDVREALEGQQARRESIEKQASRDGLRIKGWMPDRTAKDLAQKHGRLDEYLDYRLLSHFVHGSHFAAIQRTTIPSQGVILIGGQAADAEVWIESAALGAAQSMLHATRAIRAILDLPESPEIAPLLARVDSLAPPDPSSSS